MADEGTTGGKTRLKIAAASSSVRCSMPARRSASVEMGIGAGDVSVGTLITSVAVADVLKTSSAIELTGVITGPASLAAASAAVGGEAAPAPKCTERGGWAAGIRRGGIGE